MTKSSMRIPASRTGKSAKKTVGHIARYLYGDGGIVVKNKDIEDSPGPLFVGGSERIHERSDNGEIVIRTRSVTVQVGFDGIEIPAPEVFFLNAVSLCDPIKTF